MTRENAKIKVELLDNYLSHTCQDYGERDHDAMMMAVKALDQLDKIKQIVKECQDNKLFSGDAVFEICEVLKND